MKKVFTAVVMIIGILSFAQETKSKEDTSKRLTEQLRAEQKIQLYVKELALQLDLNASQQKEMTKLFTEKEAKSEALRTAMRKKKAAGTKLTADERSEWKNKMLDEKIATKKKLKKILAKKQFEKWVKMSNNKKLIVRKKMMLNKYDAKQE